MKSEPSKPTVDPGLALKLANKSKSRPKKNKNKKDKKKEAKDVAQPQKSEKQQSQEQSKDQKGVNGTQVKPQDKKQNHDQKKDGKQDGKQKKDQKQEQKKDQKQEQKKDQKQEQKKDQKQDSKNQNQQKQDQKQNEKQSQKDRHSTPSPASSATPSQELVDQKRQEAVAAYEQEVAKADNKKLKTKQQGSDDRFLSTAIKSGTLSDKVAALTLMVQQAPMQGQRHLDALMNMARKKGKRESQMAMEALKDLFINNLLPDRKLKFFHSQPITPTTPTKTLLEWYWEETLKVKYAEFVSLVEQGSHDALPFFKSAAIKALAEMLTAKPEQDKALLSALINKLGDPDRKTASKVSYLLGCLVQEHPASKLPVVKEIEYLLFRPHVGKKAQYYAIIFLNQLMLSKTEATVADHLVGLYFTLFKVLVEQGEVESKLLSAILTGVNRAYPFTSKTDEKTIDDHTTMLFKLTHTSTFNTRVQALSLLFQVMMARHTVSDRFYRALYEQLLSPELRHSSKQALFLNLLFKAMKDDVSLPRTRAFVKRLLQACLHQEPSFVCGSLFLLSEVFKEKPALRSMVLQPEGDEGDEVFRDVKSEDSDDEETFKDRPDSDAEEEDEAEEEEEEKEESSTAQDKAESSTAEVYDPRKREPLYAKAELSCLWEIVELTRNFHPSVAKWATFLIEGNAIEYQGDPLKDFTTMSFLDRFVYKKPKDESKRIKNASIMQSMRTPRVKLAAPVNSEEFLRMASNDVPDEEKFFAKFFADREKLGKKKKKKSKDEDIVDNIGDESDEDDDDADEFADELFENEIQKMGGGKADVDDDDFDEDELGSWGEDSDEDGEGPVEFGEEDDEEEMEGMEFEDDDDEEVEQAPVSKANKKAAAPKGKAAAEPAKSKKSQKGKQVEEDEEEELEGLDFDELSDGDDVGDEGVEFGEDDDDDEEEEGNVFGGFGEDGAEEEEEQEEKPKSKRQQRKDPLAARFSNSTFIDADEFAQILESSGRDNVNPKQREWEESKEGRGKKGGRGGKGGNRMSGNKRKAGGNGGGRNAKRRRM